MRVFNPQLLHDLLRPGKMSKHLNMVLAIFGVFSALGYFLLLGLGDVRPRMDMFFVLYASLFSIYAVTSCFVLFAAKDTRAQTKLPFHLVQIIAMAVLFRCVLLSGYPFLTDDIYRYLWDGRVWQAGINPYLYAPDSAALSVLRDTVIHPYINHPGIPTIYAPMLQFLFRAVYIISPTFVGMKAAVSLFDLGSIAVLIALLDSLKMDKRLVVFYAWNPLAIIETAGSGHVDSYGVFWLLLFMLFFMRGNVILAALALAASVLTKFIALIVLPFVVLRFGWRKSAHFALVFGIAVLAAYGPFLDAGRALFAALSVYTTKWLFNASLFHIVHKIVVFVHPSDNLDANLMIAKKILAMAFMGLSIWLFLRRKRIGYQANERGILHEWFILFGAICIISPTLHPWYLIWLLPMLVFFHNRAWILLSGLIILSYQVLVDYYQTGVWQESPATQLMIYVPFYLMLLFDHRNLHFFRKSKS